VTTTRNHDRAEVEQENGVAPGHCKREKAYAAIALVMTCKSVTQPATRTLLKYQRGKFKSR